jgi:hypothetical protein
VLHELPVDPPYLGVRVVIGETAGDSIGDPVGLPEVGSEGPVLLWLRLTFHLPHTAPDLVRQIGQPPLPILRLPTQLSVFGADPTLGRRLGDLA